MQRPDVHVLKLPDPQRSSAMTTAADRRIESMYPYAGEQYPVAYPPPPPAAKSTKSFWIACGAAGVFLAAVIAIVVVVVVVVPHTRHPAKPDITQLSEQMLVGRSSFPTIDGGQWQSGTRNPTEVP